MRVLHVICHDKGGGAERLVQEWPEEFQGITFSKFILSQHTGSRVFVIDFFKKILALYQCVKSHDVNVIHTHLNKSFYLGFLLKMLLGVQWVHTEHNTYNRRQKYAVLRFIDLMLYKFCGKVVAISDGTRSHLERTYRGLNKNVTVVNNGSRMLSLKNHRSLDGRGLRLLSIGSLTSQKGFDLAIDLINFVEDDVIESYTILGEGAMRNALEESIKKANVKVELPGWCDNVEDELREADVVLIPSRWEGFGLVALEALSTGTPIICSDVEGLNMFGSFGNSSVEIFSHQEPQSFVKSIMSIFERLLESPTDMAKQARALAERFTLDEMYLAYNEVYVRTGFSGAALKEGEGPQFK